MGLAYYQLPVSMREANLQPSVSLWRFDWGGIVAFLFAVTSFILGTTDGGAFLSSFSKPAFLIASCVFPEGISCFGLKYANEFAKIAASDNA